MKAAEQTVNTWRERLKSGSLSKLYAYARRAKRRLRGEPLGGTVQTEFPPLGLADLRAAAPMVPDHARLYYSLGRAYLEGDAEVDLRRALACLRSAEAFDFESPERSALYRALIAARRGDPEQARSLVRALVPYELTETENALRERLLRGEVTP